MLWSTRSVRSSFVLDEAKVGLDRKVLVPATLDGTKPALGFRQKHTVKLLGWNGGTTHPGLDHLVRGIRRVAGSPPATPVPAADEPVPPIREVVVSAAAAMVVAATISLTFGFAADAPQVSTAGAVPAPPPSESGEDPVPTASVSFPSDFWPGGVNAYFVEVPAGSFTMGIDSSQDPEARYGSEPQRTVDLARYYIGRYEVTVAQFRACVPTLAHVLSGI